MPNDFPGLYELGRKFQNDLAKGEKWAAARLKNVFDGVDARLEAELKILYKSIAANPAKVPVLSRRIVEINRVKTALRLELEKLAIIPAAFQGTPAAFFPANQAVAHVNQAAKAQLGKYGDAITVKAAEASVAANLSTAVGVVKSTAINGLFKSLAGGLSDQVEEAFAYHLARQTGPGPLARELRKIFNVGKHRAATIARTETLRVYRETTRAIYDENKDLIKGYIWVARLTTRTCAVCWAMHGSFHPNDEPFGTHPSCRCVMVPFMGGKNPVTLGPTVFKNLPEDKQRKILGPKKLELYKSGVPIKYAVGYRIDPTWGPIRWERSAGEMEKKVLIPNAIGKDKLPAGTHAQAVAAAKAKKAAAPGLPPIPANQTIVDNLNFGFDAPAQAAASKNLIADLKDLLDDINDTIPGPGKVPALPKNSFTALQKIDPDLLDQNYWDVLVKQYNGDQDKVFAALRTMQKIRAGNYIPDADEAAILYRYSVAKKATDDAIAARRAAAKAAKFKTVPDPTVNPYLPTQPADLDHDGLKLMDLHTSDSPWGEVTPGKKLSYGGVIFDDSGRVLLREPATHFDGYVWTFPKGKKEAFDHAVDTALREVGEEVGHLGQITGFVPGKGIGGSGDTYHFLMRSSGTDTLLMDKETAAVRWATKDEAIDLIKQTTNATGQKRDLEILEAAYKERARILKGGDVWKPTKKIPPKPIPPPAPPPPPAPVFNPSGLMDFDKTVPDWELQAPVKIGKYKAPSVPDTFPADPGALETVRSLGGTTGAKLVKDPATGRLYVLKKGNSADHIRSEFYADEVYRAMGVNVPKAHLYETASGPVKIAEYIEGQTLQSLQGSPAFIAARDQLQDGLAIDALLGNYDVVGQDLDNILVDAAGAVWRIDNGGSLRFRAQGQLKTRWDEHVSTLWTLRGRKVLADDGVQNAATAVFRETGIFKISKQIAKITPAAEKRILAALPDDLRDVVRARISTMRDVARHVDALNADAWTETLADDVARHVVGIRADRIPDLFPKQLGPKQGSYGVETFYDETGKKWDTLRDDTDGTNRKFNKYLADRGLDYRIISEWQGAQAGHSWSDDVRAFKAWLSEQIKHEPGGIFWHSGGKARAMKLYEQHRNNYGKTTWSSIAGDDVYHETMAAKKAFTMEFYSRVNLPNYDRASRVITLIRTEDKDILPIYGITPNFYQDNLRMKKGLSESYGLVTKSTVHGHEVTIQELSYTRLHSFWGFGRQGSPTSSTFCGTGENEIPALWREKTDLLDYIEPHRVKSDSVVSTVKKVKAPAKTKGKK